MVKSRIVDIMQGKIDKKELTKEQAVTSIKKHKNNFLDYEKIIRQLKL